ncbi:MAG: hypothetical protein IJH39_02820 [Clostridia bacterium]|nr:hypothetical protein [Clostridia bacterium]
MENYSELKEDEIEFNKKILHYRSSKDKDFRIYKQLRVEAGDNPRLIEILCKKIVLNIIDAPSFVIENREDVTLFKNFSEVIDYIDKTGFMYRLSSELSLEKLFEKLSDAPETAVEIFSLISSNSTKVEKYEEFQDKYIDKLFDLAKNTKKHKENLYRIWKTICNDELKLDKLNEVFTYTGLANNPEAMSKIQQTVHINKDFLYMINPKFLEANFINVFSVEQLMYIVSFPKFQEDLTKLDSNELVNMMKLVNRIYPENEEWKGPLNKILQNVKEKKFGDLLKDNELSYDNQLVSVLSNKNYFEIYTKEDLDSLDNKKEEVTVLIKNGNQELLLEKYPEIAKLELNEQMKLMACENILGLSLDEAKNLVLKYGEDIDNIGNEYSELFLKNYVKTLKAIINEDNSEKLAKLLDYGITPKERIKDSHTIESMLKFTYGKKYDVANVDFNSLKPCKVKGLEGINVLDAGVNFSMIISSVGAYCENEDENYYDSWNRPSLSSDIISTSFIRNDMMGRANCPKLYFGFNNMSANALELSGSADLFSKSDSIKSRAVRALAFYTPDTQIGQTGRKRNSRGKIISPYNEMDYKRIQDGIRKQPDYIVVFGSYGDIIENQSGQMLMDDNEFPDASVTKKERAQNIKKAISDFEIATGKKLPVVFVDLHKIYRNEEKTIEQLREEYKIDPSEENKRKLIKRIINFNSYKHYKLPIEFSEEEIERFDKIENNVSDFLLTDTIIEDITSFDFKKFGQEKNNYRIKRLEKINSQENIYNNKFSLRKLIPIVSSRDNSYRIGNNPFKAIRDFIKKRKTQMIKKEDRNYDIK